MKKNLKKYLSLVFFLIVCVAYSQDTLVRRYVPLPEYKQAGNKVTEKDSANFQFHNGDTLVQILEDYNFARNKNNVKVPYESKDSVFLNLYKNVVYNTDNSNTDEYYMRYWKDSIKIYFEPSVPENHSEELMQFVNKLSKDIDSLNIQRVFEPNKANYRVYYLNAEYSKDFEPRISRDGYYVHWNGKNQIYKAALKLNTNLIQNQHYQLELLKFHFFRSLGYFKASKNLACKSYLSGCESLKKLTKTDLELLKYHYSYGICKGVNLKTFEELHASMRRSKEKHPNLKLYVVHPE